jgi:FkbM family methyltransferase
VAPREKTWKWRSAQALSTALDRAERLLGARFYDLHLAAAALRHRKGKNLVNVTAGQQVITFRAPTARALWRAETLLTKEPATIRWINSFRSQDIFWDVGANIGIYSLYAAKIKNIATLAFEPAGFNYALLCDNVRLNGSEDRLRAYCIAFSSRSHLGELSAADDEPGAAIASIEEVVGAIKQGVLAFSIDDFVRYFNPLFPTHIKIDVDGIEDQILEGSAVTLANPKLRSLLIEVDERRAELPVQIDAYLKRYGLELVQVEGSPLAPRSASRNRIYWRQAK